MRRLKKLGSIAMWTYMAAITIPESGIDRHLPAPAAALLNGAFDLVEQTAAEGFDAIRGQLRDRSVASS